MAALTTAEKEEFYRLREQIRRDRRKFIDLGLPQLGHRQGSSSHSSINNRHDNATVHQRQFSVLQDVQLQEHTSSIWSCQPPLWPSEAATCRLVWAVLQDAINAAGLAQDLHLIEGLGLFDNRSDFWDVTFQGMPLGVVKGTKPTGGRVLENQELVEYMMHNMLYNKHYLGVRHVFGVMSTYDQWRFFWLPESDAYANASTMAELSAAKDDGDPATAVAAKSSVRRDNSDSDDSESGESESDTESSGGGLAPPSHQLHASEVYKWNHPDIVPLLTSLIHKIWHSPRDPVRLLVGARIKLVQAELSWVPLPKTITAINDDPSALARCRHTCFFLLRSLGGGRDGRVWRACTSKGVGCVIKFSNLGSDDYIPNPIESRRRALQQEADVWRGAWELQTRVVTLDNMPALVMPYARHLEHADQVKHVTKAVQRMAARGYRHKDMRWRHVGFLPDNEPILFDLAEVKQFDAQDETAREKAIRKMLDALWADIRHIKALQVTTEELEQVLGPPPISTQKEVSS